MWFYPLDKRARSLHNENRPKLPTRLESGAGGMRFPVHLKRGMWKNYFLL